MLTVTLIVRFLLELAAVAAVAAWGFNTAATTPARLLLGVALPLAVVVIWGAFIGPNATSPAAVKALLQIAVFGAAALALAALRGPTQATAFIAVVALDAGLMAALEN